MIIPYKLLLSKLDINDTTVTVSIRLFQFLLRQMLQSIEFDEERYLRVNPDVAVSVRQGKWVSGKDHFVARGYFEDREGALNPVSEAWYLRMNPDVADAVKLGEWSSAINHFNQNGVFEWRAPSKEMQEVFARWKDAVSGEA